MADNNGKEKVSVHPPVPTVEIPDLKKKQKERKKGGAVWGTGGGGAGAFEGATGAGEAGARAAASAAASGAQSGAAGAASGAARALQFGGGFFGRLLSALLSPFAQLIARLAATAAGRFALSVMAVAVVGGIALIAAALMRGGSAAPRAGDGAADLGTIASSIKVRGPADQGLKYAANANNGTIKFGNVPKAGESTKADKDKAAKEDQAQGELSQGAGESDASEKSNTACVQGSDDPAEACPETHISGSKLSGELGGALAGSRAGMAKALRFSSRTGKLGKLAGDAGPKASGKIVKSGIRGSTRANLGRRGLVNSRALGQLRSAGLKNALVIAGGPTATEGNSAAAASQFEGSGANGTPPSSPTDATGPSTGGGGGGGGGTINPLGNGYSCTNAQSEAGGMEINGVCVVCGQGQTVNPQDGSCINIGQGEGAPWKAMLDEAYAKVQEANNLILWTSILVTTGLALLATGWPPTMIIGAILIAIGQIIGMMAMMAGMKVVQIGNQISAMGGLASTYGDKVKKIGQDIEMGAVMAMMTGILGFIMYDKVKKETDSLYHEAEAQLDAFEKSRSIDPGAGGGTSGTDTNPLNPNDISLTPPPGGTTGTGTGGGTGGGGGSGGTGGGGVIKK